MKYMKMGGSELQIPQIAVGCGNIGYLDEKAAEAMLQTALDHGANFFDMANIYAQGQTEINVGKAMHWTADKREKVIIESKCGVIRSYEGGKHEIGYDLSKDHIIKCVEESLKRLQTDYLDILLLHRPDALMEPEEVAAAFDLLEKAGKVKYFGVSNFNTSQIELLQRTLDQKIMINQMKMSVAYCPMVWEELNPNGDSAAAYNRTGYMLEYCRMNHITVQAWSTIQYGLQDGTFINSEKFPKLNAVMEEMGKKYGLDKNGMATLWLLRHPAHIMPITGTTNCQRLIDSLNAADREMSREDWYEMYLAAKENRKKGEF